MPAVAAAEFSGDARTPPLSSYGVSAKGEGRAIAKATANSAAFWKEQFENRLY
jgi:hypothetical protein